MKIRKNVINALEKIALMECMDSFLQECFYLWLVLIYERVNQR